MRRRYPRGSGRCGVGGPVRAHRRGTGGRRPLERETAADVRGEAMRFGWGPKGRWFKFQSPRPHETAGNTAVSHISATLRRPVAGSIWGPIAAESCPASRQNTWIKRSAAPRVSGCVEPCPGERLKGFEPSTFCMASRRCRPDSVRKVAGNREFSSCDGRTRIPRLSPGNHGDLAPNGHPKCRRPPPPDARRTLADAARRSPSVIAAPPTSSSMRPAFIVSKAGR
jgi:hypothetical protein